MKITQLPNKILRKKSEKVVLPLSDNVKRYVLNMIKHIDDSQTELSKDRAGIGIAAPQIGVNLKMFYVNIPDETNGKNYREFLINPKIIGSSDTICALASGEGCLSVNESKFKTDGYIKRQFKIIIQGYSYFQKKEVTITKVGYHAVVFQHEVDHIDGKLFIDHINKKEPWKKENNLILI